MADAWKTEQETFWSGAFGDDYADRNRGEALVASRAHMLSNALRRAGPVASAVEFGPNIGLNLVALRRQIGRAHSELQSLMRHSYAVFCLKKKTIRITDI